MRLRCAFALLGAAVVAALLSPSVARAATTYEVQVGRFLKQEDPTRESMRFYPGSIDVHQGDILHFTSESLHSVALLPAGAEAASWAAANAGGTDKLWSLFRPDPDEGARALKANLGAVLPSSDCGWIGRPTCSFVGEGDDLGGVLSSGLPFSAEPGTPSVTLDFTVSIDAEPGQTFWAIDFLYPKMAMQIDVVGSDEPASDPTTIATSNNSLFRKDVAAANALHKKYVDKQVSKKVGGKTTWTAWAGVETATVSLRKMYPATLTIKKGHKVKWTFGLNRFSDHSVTFPAARATSIGEGFPEIVCDPDTDDPNPLDEPVADAAPSTNAFPYCSNPSQLELDVPNDFVDVLGDGKVTSANDLASSGVRGTGIAVSNAAYTLTFTKPGKGYTYGDAVSSIGGLNMRGKVVVKR